MATATDDIAILTECLSKLGRKVSRGETIQVDIRNSIVASAKQLIDAVSVPEEHALQRSINLTELVAIRAILELRVLETIPLQSDINMSDLSRKTGAQSALLERLLRLLVGTRFIQQSEDGSYSHSRMSRGYLGLPGDWLSFLNDEVARTFATFPDYLAVHPWVEPNSIKVNPYCWVHGEGTADGLTFWEVMEQYPERLARFQRGLGMMSPLTPITGYYDFSNLATSDKSRMVLVDVGGGQGNCTADILKAHPELDATQMVVQDRPKILTLAEQNPDLPKEVHKMEHDFYTEQPVKGARAYYFRMIMHDYSDEVATGILKQVVRVMAADSKVLLADLVVPDRIDEGTLPAAVMDNYMLGLGGKERTAAMWKHLVEAAGLRLLNIWHPPGIAQGLVEATLA